MVMLFFRYKLNKEFSMQLTLNEKPINITKKCMGREIHWSVDWAIIKESEAKELQAEAGYHECGYFFFDFCGNKWKSYSSCD
jgi:hypothetical protein